MDVVWDAPGPGSWQLDRSHYDAALTPIGYMVARGSDAAYRTGFAEAGVPADGTEFRVVNGFIYTRVRPLFGADRPTAKTPPDWVVKLVGRLHPEMRRREKLAADRLAQPRFRAALAEWTTTIRPRVVARNRSLQAIDLGALDDAALAAHVNALIDHAYQSCVLHHRLHMDDLGPLGAYVVFCRDRGIDPTLALKALAGASPSTVEPRRQLTAIRRTVEAAGIKPTSLDEVRAAGPEAARLLDDYLEHHGSVLFSGYDIDTPTLRERPGVILAAIMSATAPAEHAMADTIAADLRGQIPTGDQAEFDRTLADAREAMDMRDDNGPITVEWPGGLLRLGLLEVGHRLAERGAAAHARHVFELEADEVATLLLAGTGPTAAELSERAERREGQRSLDPPPCLGDEPEDPPLHLLPPSMGQAMDMVNTVISALFGAQDPAAPPLSGSGIGSEPYTGIARVAETAEEAITAMEPGDVLVTRATSPAFNLVLGIAGALVTVHGGPMSHAAVLSRELDLPAVIGVQDCLSHITTGDRIEVDPARGVVSVVG